MAVTLDTVYTRILLVNKKILKINIERFTYVLLK